MDPLGSFLYLPDGTGNLFAFDINPSLGSLTAFGPFSVPNSSNGGAIDPTGRFLYLAQSGFDSVGVAGFTVGDNGSSITPMVGSPFPTDLGPRQVAITPSGKFAYVANENANDVSAYSINPQTGVLTQIAGSPFPAPGSPFCITIDASGKFLFVGGVNGAQISAFTINQSTGGLTPVSGSPYSGNASWMQTTAVVK
jgi:6-phosphogluconolactonase (cycloisomerase 2 family)